MKGCELVKLLRVMIMDSLISQSGKVLLPDLIGQLTSEILERVLDVLERKID